MNLARCFGTTCCAFVLTAPSAMAVTEFNWNPALTGAQEWDVDGNWDQPGFPNGSAHVANLSVPLAASLAAASGNSEITLAGLMIGGTSAPVSTSVGEFFRFRNDDVTFNNGNALIVAGGATARASAH